MLQFTQLYKWITALNSRQNVSELFPCCMQRGWMPSREVELVSAGTRLPGGGMCKALWDVQLDSIHAVCKNILLPLQSLMTVQSMMRRCVSSSFNKSASASTANFWSSSSDASCLSRTLRPFAGRHTPSSCTYTGSSSMGHCCAWWQIFRFPCKPKALHIKRKRKWSIKITKSRT